jgi:hypothetical protein
MVTFFAGFAILSSLSLISAAIMGYLGSSYHLMTGLFSAVLAISCHCLIFAIFTGSGKDTRLLVEDWKLDSEFVKRTKVFKRTVFPPALYAILFLLVVTTLGGALSTGGAWLQTLHGVLALGTLYYNLKTFYQEYLAVKENAAILAEVNRTAGALLKDREAEPEQFEEGIEKIADLEWGTHVFALGKFLCFMGWNVWLVYLYVHWIMGVLKIPLWPFLLSSLLLLLVGYYLRYLYRSFRPQV